MRSAVAWCLLMMGCAPSQVSDPSTASARAALVSAERDVADLSAGQPSAGWAARVNGHLRAVGGASQGLLVWVEDRSGQDDIWGTRIDPTGAVMDPGGLLISVGPVIRSSLAVASSGSEYLVAWDESFNSGPQQVRGTIVQNDGTVRTPAGFTIFSGANWVDPAASFDGTRFVVVARSGPAALGARRVSPQGVIIDPTPISIIGPSVTGAPAVASRGQVSLVVWPDNRLGNDRIFGCRLDATGALLDPGGRQFGQSAGPQGNVAVASGVSDWVVSWVDSFPNPAQASFTRVSPAGARVDPADRLLPSDTRALFSTPTLTWDGTRYTVGWMRQTPLQVYAARLESDGGVLDMAGFPVVVGARSLESPSLLTVGSTVLMAFSDRAYLKGQVRGTRLANGAAIDAPPRLLSLTANGQQQLAMAARDGGALLAWAEQRDTTFFDVRATRLDPTGQPLDVPPLTLAGSTDDESEPAVAFDGTTWLLAWTRRPMLGGSALVEGVRLSIAGQVVGAPLSYGVGNQPTVAASPAGALVAWSKYQDAVTTNDIAFTRVSPAGLLLDVPARYAVTAPFNQTSPRAAFDGTRYLLTWEDARNTGQAEVYAARVELDGTLPDGTGLLLSNGAGFGRLPSVAASPTEFLVTWSQQPPSTSAIMGNRITGGMVRDGTGFVVANMTVAYPNVGPAVRWDGTRFNVAWTDVRDGGAPELYSVALSGTSPQSEEDVGPGTTPVLAGVPNGWGMVAAERLDLSPSFKNRRARVRLTGLRAEGAACAANECLPPLTCYLGLCCAGACGDAGTPDGGAPDAGPGDAGPGDAGPGDAGPGDAGPEDAGGVADAGPGPPRQFAVGCQSSPSLAAWAALAVLARATGRRRRGAA